MKVYYPIGHVFTYSRRLYRVVDGGNEDVCDKCAFRNYDCAFLACTAWDRKDGKEIYAEECTINTENQEVALDTNSTPN